MWTPADPKDNNWTASLQILDAGKWRDFNYAEDEVSEGTKLTFTATYEGVPLPAEDETEWRLIVVDGSKFNVYNTETIDEPCDMHMDSEDEDGKSIWSGVFTISAAVATVASKSIQVGMVDQTQREKHLADPSGQKAPTGIEAPGKCTVD